MLWSNPWDQRPRNREDAWFWSHDATYTSDTMIHVEKVRPVYAYLASKLQIALEQTQHDATDLASNLRFVSEGWIHHEASDEERF